MNGAGAGATGRFYSEPEPELSQMWTTPHP